jgi:hypothetical protein
VTLARKEFNFDELNREAVCEACNRKLKIENHLSIYLKSDGNQEKFV